ncbi:MAG: molybdopterin-dependent oxidoreductase [Flavobacteriales bacterium]|jgi:hypothetical protein|nr:molybdopterin-dependent oxidoreductase [Flavobacteriales bacterium]
MKHLPKFILVLLVPVLSCQQAVDTSVAGGTMAAASTASANEGHGCMKRIPSGDTTSYISHSIEVYGDVETPLTMGLEDLRSLPVHQGADFDVICQTGTKMSEAGSFKGALLRDVLDKAKLAQENHKDRNFYIVAQATDDYMATFSWAEIYNLAVGDSTFILYEVDGASIGGKGEFMLITSTDKKTGPRHVYWLSGIGVHKVRMES